MPVKPSKAKFKVGQVVCWKKDDSYTMKIASILYPTLDSSWRFLYEMATPGFSGKWDEIDLRPLTRKEKGLVTLTDAFDARNLREELDAAIFNKHGGGSVSSRWTVDSILDAIMPVIERTIASGPTCHKCGKLVETGSVFCDEHEAEVIEALIAKRLAAPSMALAQVGITSPTRLRAGKGHDANYQTSAWRYVANGWAESASLLLWRADGAARVIRSHLRVALPVMCADCEQRMEQCGRELWIQEGRDTHRAARQRHEGARP